jgi:hypothetical protein
VNEKKTTAKSRSTTPNTAMMRSRRRRSRQSLPNTRCCWRPKWAPRSLHPREQTNKDSLTRMNGKKKFMLKGGTLASAGGPRQSAETGIARAETLGPDGGQRTWKPGPDGAEGPTGAQESAHSLFPSGTPNPGKRAGARGGLGRGESSRVSSRGCCGRSMPGRRHLDQAQQAPAPCRARAATPQSQHS